MNYVVTGGAQGIGRAVVERLLARGERVVVVDRDISPLDGHASAERLTAFSGDVRDAQLLNDACTVADAIDGVVACAGISRPGASLTYPAETWDDVIGIDLSGVFTTFVAGAKRANAGASFVAISSISGLQGFAGRAAYGAAKAGVDGLVRSMAVELAPHVRVNSIAPGYVRTQLVETNLASGVIDEGVLIGRTPMGRLGDPEDIARSILFLLSEESSWITGTTLVVDGGWTAYGLGPGATS